MACLRHSALSVACVLLCVITPALAGEPARFVRAINLNGPALNIDGRAWEAGAAADFKTTGKAFANQKVALKPPTDATRAELLRGSAWGAKVDVTVSGLAAGPHQVVP